MTLVVACRAHFEQQQQELARKQADLAQSEEQVGTMPCTKIESRNMFPGRPLVFHVHLENLSFLLSASSLPVQIASLQQQLAMTQQQVQQEVQESQEIQRRIAVSRFLRCQIRTRIKNSPYDYMLRAEAALVRAILNSPMTIQTWA